MPTPRPTVATPQPSVPPTQPPAASGPSADTRALLERLRQGRKDERVSALLELGDRREDAAYVVPALAEALRDTNEDVRLRAAEALGKFGAAAVPAQAALVSALDGPDMVATEAAKSLGKLGPNAREAPAALGRALQRSDVYLRREAAKALGRFGPAAATATGALIDALTSDKDKIVRLNAAQALGAIGSGAQAAVPALRRALDDKEALVAVKAREALLRITGSER
jgi:HEAT repeat protein